MSEPLLDDETRRWVRGVFRVLFGPPNPWHVAIGIVVGIAVIFYLLRLA